jgi:hypothetical protein
MGLTLVIMPGQSTQAVAPRTLSVEQAVISTDGTAFDVEKYVLDNSL